MRHNPTLTVIKEQETLRNQKDTGKPESTEDNMPWTTIRCWKPMNKLRSFMSSNWTQIPRTKMNKLRSFVTMKTEMQENTKSMEPEETSYQTQNEQWKEKENRGFAKMESNAKRMWTRKEEVGGGRRGREVGLNRKKTVASLPEVIGFKINKLYLFALNTFNELNNLRKWLGRKETGRTLIFHEILQLFFQILSG